MTSFLQDGLFLVALLTGSAACVAVSLWLAQRLDLPKAIESNPFQIGSPHQPNRKMLRTGLGLLSVGVSLIMMLGVVPGSSFLHPWTSMSCIGTAILGMLTIASAQRSPQVATAAESQHSDQHVYRKAA